jgi:hypothetical protein
MLMISDTSQEFTEPEMTFIGQAIEICPVAVIVATKTDLYPHWREIVHANTGITAPLIPASSSLRSHAVRLNDAELNEESNFPTLVEAGLDAVAMPQLRAADMGAGLSGFKSLARLEAKPPGKGHKIITGMRGSYGGMLMFGMLTSLTGLPLINPLSVGAGLLLGRKAYKEDVENRLMRARSDRAARL